jgi:hypothetical protein
VRWAEHGPPLEHNVHRFGPSVTRGDPGSSPVGLDLLHRAA